MNRQELIARFLEVAARAEKYSSKVANAIRQAINGEEIPRVWLVRWSKKGREWESDPESPKRVIGNAWVLAAWTSSGGLPWIIPEQGRFQAVREFTSDPVNKQDLEDAQRARQFGFDVTVQPVYRKPEPSRKAKKDEFERIIAAARPCWVDDALRGNVVTGYEPGCDEEGRSIEVPVFGDEIEYGTGFRVDGVPNEWIGAYSNVTAYSEDGYSAYYAPFSVGSGGSAVVADISEDAEWRIPRHLVEQLKLLEDEVRILRKQEEEDRRKRCDEVEKKRLAEKFGV